MELTGDLVRDLKRAGCLSDVGLVHEMSKALDIKMELIDSNLQATLEHHFSDEIENKLLFYAFKKAEEGSCERYDKILDHYAQ